MGQSAQPLRLVARVDWGASPKQRLRWWGHRGLTWRAGSGCSPSCQRQTGSQMTLTEHEGRRTGSHIALYSFSADGADGPHSFVTSGYVVPPPDLRWAPEEHGPWGYPAPVHL